VPGYFVLRLQIYHPRCFFGILLLLGDRFDLPFHCFDVEEHFDLSLTFTAEKILRFVEFKNVLKKIDFLYDLAVESVRFLSVFVVRTEIRRNSVAVLLPGQEMLRNIQVPSPAGPDVTTYGRCGKVVHEVHRQEFFVSWTRLLVGEPKTGRMTVAWVATLC
jgi:hypothetical protein